MVMKKLWYCLLIVFTSILFAACNSDLVTSTYGIEYKVVDITTDDLKRCEVTMIIPEDYKGDKWNIRIPSNILHTLEDYGNDYINVNPVSAFSITVYGSENEIESGFSRGYYHYYPDGDIANAADVILGDYNNFVQDFDLYYWMSDDYPVAD